MDPARITKGAVVVLALVGFAALGWRANLLGVRTERPFGSVASAFDQTPAHPGYAWTREGRAVRLFLSPSDEDRWIYVGGPSNIERWPRSDPKTLCS